MPTLCEVPFLASIPRGHDVLVVTFNLGDKSPSVVLDRTAANLYCTDELWGPLHQDPALAVTDPIAVAKRWNWKIKNAIQGVCAGAMISTKSWGGDNYEVKTLLVLETPAAPYR